MILNLQKITKLDKLRSFLLFLKEPKRLIAQHFELKKLFQDSRELKNIFRDNYPELKVSESGELKCVSCRLCEDVCPTQAIKIEESKMFSLPKSPISGEIPNAFHLDLDLCRKCDLCRLVCAVDALEMKGLYSNQSNIDLVKYALE